MTRQRIATNGVAVALAALTAISLGPAVAPRASQPYHPPGEYWTSAARSARPPVRVNRGTVAVLPTRRKQR